MNNYKGFDKTLIFIITLLFLIGEVLIALFSNDWENLISLFNEKRG